MYIHLHFRSEHWDLIAVAAEIIFCRDYEKITRAATLEMSLIYIYI